MVKMTNVCLSTQFEKVLDPADIRAERFAMLVFAEHHAGSTMQHRVAMVGNPTPVIF